MVNLSTLDYDFYKYNPSVAAASIFIVVFLVVTSTHAYYAWNYRAKFFIAFVLGGIFEIMGYVGRALSHNNIKAIGPYVIQNVFLLVAPALFAATIYMVLGRIIRLLEAQHHSPVRVTWLTKIFVCGDILCFVIQANGANLTIINSDMMLMSTYIVVGGLVLQVLIFVFFVVVAMVFHTRINKLPTVISANPAIPWRKHLRALYITSGFILVRNVVRAIEFAQGTEGMIVRHEAFLYIFDATLMALVFVVFIFCHPCALLSIDPVRAQDDGYGLLEMGKQISPSAPGTAYRHEGKR